MLAFDCFGETFGKQVRKGNKTVVTFDKQLKTGDEILPSNLLNSGMKAVREQNTLKEQCGYNNCGQALYASVPR